VKLTDAQTRALKRLSDGPAARGFFLSGWGPQKHGYGAHRVDITEATANGLISRGLAERWEVEGDESAATLRITDAGRTALRKGDGREAGGT